MLKIASRTLTRRVNLKVNDVRLRFGGYRNRISKHHLSTSASSSPPVAQSSSTTSDKVVGFLDQNGGKLLLLAFAIVGALVYTYYESIQDRNRIEKAVEDDSNIEPYEIQMLRASNSLSLGTFKSIIDGISSSSWSWDSEVSYEDIVKVTSSLRPIKLGYILDRAAYFHTLRINKQLKNIQSPASISFHEVKLPTSYFVALMNLTMESNVDDRLQGLYYACRTLNNLDDNHDITRDILISMIQALVDTDQIPTEKQVEETGVKYPIRLHRRRSAERMVANYETQTLKLNDQKETWSEGEFVQVMTSRFVCTWASCYRGS